MDFGKLLSVAQKNSSSKQSVSYYSTKFTPPKKETKQSRALSNNIKKFLARKEEEDKKKALEEKRKKENLLSMRDHKAQSRINKHLKVCKAANKSVLADAVNTEDTAVTITGPSQPDEDDYGYVSQEASAFYDRLMNKYNNTPDKPLFSDSGKRVAKDIASTKDRVKQALKQQEIDDSLPHRSRKRKSSDLATTSGTTKDNECEQESQREKDKDNDKVKKKRPPMPPPMDFVSLLKLAEKKQYEPVVVEPKPKPKTEIAEFERPMTKKQKKEFIKEKEWRDKKREREKNNDQHTSNSSVNSNSNNTSNSTGSNDQTSKSNKCLVNKHNSKLYNELTSVKSTNNKSTDGKTLSPKSTHISNPPTKIKNDINNKLTSTKVNSKPVTSEKDEILEERRKLEMEKRKLESMRRMIEEEKRKLAIESKNKRIAQEAKSSSMNKLGKSNDKIESSSSNLKDSNKSKQLSSTNNINKSRVAPADSVKSVKQFPPADCFNNKPKQFPPPDVRRKPMRPSMNGNGTRPMSINKRRIYDDEEEFDSELDDFIDDDPQGESQDYSKYISEIFGYDKSKYRNFDDDDMNMESNYAQQLREEFVSTKIGIMEDLEDIRQEAFEKKQKAMMKKTKRKL